MKLYSDDVAPVKRKNTDELFLVRIVAKPSPKNIEDSKAGGAYVNCWMDTDDLRTAEKKAIRAIQSEKWQPVKFDHWEIVCRRCYVEATNYSESEKRDFLQRVDEAFEYGYSLTFNTWPPDAPDADDEDI